MSLLFSRILFTVIIIGMAYFALVKVWTQKVDIFALLKKPSEGIPISENKSMVAISPSEYTAHPIYQEFTAYVTNNNNYPIYDYAVVIMVSKGDLNVNTALKFEPIETMGSPSSEIPVQAFGLGGTSDKYGLSYMELHFPEIGANSSKKYLVKINGDKYKDASIIEFSVGKYSKDPNPIYRSKTDSKGNLILPNSMKKK
jgi:hypothetical protein